jgi:dienelactone hydrolase
VIVHGSEPGTRVLYGVWVGFYTSLGLTVLTYDKRGNGESTGSYPGELASEPALNKFADDAAACLRFLARWPGVDSRQVGFHGGSQGGWTVPLAIKRVPSAAFAVLLSGPAVSVGQQAAWSAASDDASHLPTDAPAAIDSMMRAAADVGYQPRPVLQALKIPVLWLNGETDRHVPTALNTEILRGMRKPNFYLQVLPGVSHGLLENPTGLDADDATSQRLARDLFMRMATWLAAHAGSSAMS